MESKQKRKWWNQNKKENKQKLKTFSMLMDERAVRVYRTIMCDAVWKNSMARDGTSTRQYAVHASQNKKISKQLLLFRATLQHEVQRCSS